MTTTRETAERIVVEPRSVGSADERNEWLIGRIESALNAERERCAKIKFANTFVGRESFAVSVGTAHSGVGIWHYKTESEAEALCERLNRAIAAAIREGE